MTVDTARSGIISDTPPLHLLTGADTTQNLAPTYEQLADAFSHVKDKVVIAKVDADGAGKPLGSRFGVTGFPSESGLHEHVFCLVWR